jgi:dipeptidyl aminopeptidase/acylaminoacyl peptidase
MSNSHVADTRLGPIEYQISGDDSPVLLFLHGTPGGYDQGIEEPELRVLSALEVFAGTEGMDNDIRQMSDLELAVDQIRAPVLLVHGTADTNVPFAHSEGLAAVLSNASRHGRLKGANCLCWLRIKIGINQYDH